ncbi:MAG: UPF0280 family protein [Candidatus Micrarchaeia archaeon]
MLYEKTVILKETNVMIKANTKRAVANAESALIRCRQELENYIERDRTFLTSLAPVDVSPSAPDIVKGMAEAAREMNVGPMASVAGAIADAMLDAALSAGATTAIVENGGDIAVYVGKGEGDIEVGIYAGNSPFSEKIGLRIRDGTGRMGVCTSSGTVGHSLSFGKADAVVVVADNATLADAAATSIGNMVSEKEDITTAIARAKKMRIHGVIIIIDNFMGVWGNLPQIVRV